MTAPKTMTMAETMTMDDDTPRIGGQIGRVLLIAVAGLCAIFGAGVIVGVLTAFIERGGNVDARLIAILAGVVLLAGGAAWIAIRAARSFNRAAGTPTTRERRGRAMMIACIAIGMGIGLVLTLAEPSLEIFSGAPLSAPVALALAFVIAVPLPILSWYWHHRVADEQEADAYRTGAMLGMYAFWIGAPVWWLLWRGGIVPAPDGVLLYFVTIAVASIVWLWAKYR